VTKLSACGDHESRNGRAAEIAAAALMESKRADVVVSAPTATPL